MSPATQAYVQQPRSGSFLSTPLHPDHGLSLPEVSPPCQCLRGQTLTSFMMSGLHLT